ncbi:MAG: hypothetical protein Q4C56_07090 [Peptococcaceae bacterium]|nr:hypothetical protein [Peptococcaceae bacterium]
MHQKKRAVKGESFFFTDKDHTQTVPCYYERVQLVTSAGTVEGYRPIYLSLPSGDAVVVGEKLESINEELT